MNLISATRLTRSWIAGALALGLGCASQPPRELLEARAAYARAAAGPAAQARPSALTEAQVALERAERAHAHGPREDARAYSHVAMRKAETSEALGRALLAAERRNRADHVWSHIQGERAARDLAARATTPVDAVPGTSEPLADATSNPVERSASTPPSEAPAPQVPAPPGESTKISAVAPEVSGQPRPLVAEGVPAEVARTRLTRVASVRDDGRTLVLTVGAPSIFAQRSAHLSPTAGAVLDPIADTVSAAPSGASIVVQAYGADPAGSGAALMLNQQRAEAVRSYLLARGAEPSRVTARGNLTETLSDARVNTDVSDENFVERIEITLPAIR